MLKYLSLISALALVGCKKDADSYVIEREVVQTETITQEVSQDFEGEYYFEDESGLISGPVQITTNSDGEVQVSQSGSSSQLKSQNPNGTYGIHPRISFSRVDPVNSSYFWYARDITYDSSKNDIEKDDGSGNLSNGKLYTVYEFEIVDGLLNITISIFSGSTTSGGNINNIEVVRTFTEVQ